MMQFSFTTNIEKRSPWTGNVYFVDRMTSSYAIAHPFDVDGFLEDVYQRWQQCDIAAYRETREAIRKVWTSVLSVTRPSGNASLYPNKGADKHPALMEVWHKAGDFWRSGLRIGDVLPAIVPGHKITRLGNGEWICLFPKDMALLEYNEPEKSVAADAESENDISIIICNATTEATVDLNSDTEVCEPECSENVPLEDTDTEALGNDPVADVNLKSLALENLTEADAGAQREAREDEIPASRLRPSRPTREDIQQQRRMTWAERQEREAQEAEDEERRQQRRKVLAAVGATIATLVLVNYFGLIGPALFGLVAGGLIKG